MILILIVLILLAYAILTISVGEISNTIYEEF